MAQCLVSVVVVEAVRQIIVLHVKGRESTGLQDQL